MNLEETESLSEQIVKYISEQIISGELVEGERIQELRIAKELDVSRGQFVRRYYYSSVRISLKFFRVVVQLFRKCRHNRSKRCLIQI